MNEREYKAPKVDKYDCPVCGKNMKLSFGFPSESICNDCKQAFLLNHAQDQLKSCPFCNAGRDRLRHGLFVPYFYGTEGVMVVCKECGARGGIGGIRKRITWDEPTLFNLETIEDGFKKANEKWNSRVPCDEGEWIFNRGRCYGEPAYYCSNCSEGASEYGMDKFCPNCGARMKGGES